MYFNQAKQGCSEVDNNKGIKQSHSRMFLSGIFDACRCSYEIGKTLFGKRRVRGRSRVTTLGDDSLYVYERQTARGFTLIELLVVVLIIGILAAVALPQYQLAVEKSRAAEAMVILRSIAEANRRYFLANGSYTWSLNDLDIEIPGKDVTYNGMDRKETNSFQYGARAWSASNESGFIAVASSLPVSYVLLINSDLEGIYCQNLNQKGTNVCKALGGKDTVIINGGSFYRLE